MRVLVGPARIWAGAVAPGPSASLSWSGVPASITRSLGTTYDLSQHVEYDGEESLTYSSVGTSLSGTGISLNSSTGVLSVDAGASAGTVSGIQVRVTDGSLTADSAAFAIEIVDEDLIYADDLVRLGAFRLPDHEAYSYGGPIAYRAGGSLFVRGTASSDGPMAAYTWKVSEVAIPSPSASASLGALPRASVVQSFYDATNGTLDDIKDYGGDLLMLSGLLVNDDALIASATVWYGNSQSGSHWRRPLDLASTSDIVGPVSLQAQNSAPYNPPSGGYPERLFGGPMCPIPSAWQSALGGTHLTGVGGLALVSSSSDGHAISVFNADDVGDVDPVPCFVLAGYPLGREMQQLWGVSLPTANEYYMRPDEQRAIAFIGDAVLIFGRHGMGQRMYGAHGQLDWLSSGEIIYDPARSGEQGEHSYPYRYQVWAYRASDLAKVRAGTLLHYNVKPYAVWELTVPLFDLDGKENACVVNGGSYDAASNRLYLSFHAHDENGRPLVHVFERAA